MDGERQMSMKRLVVALALALGAAGPAQADLAAGVAAFEAGNYAEAERELRPAAKNGDAEAQYRIAQMHEHGLGTVANYSVAWNWYKRAADKGHLDATARAAKLLEEGLGRPVDREGAYKLYLKAAEKGHVEAMTHVGLVNIRGEGKKADYLAGINWLQKAAAKGGKTASEELRRLAAEGFPIVSTGLTEAQAKKDDAGADPMLREVREALSLIVGQLARTEFNGLHPQAPSSVPIGVIDGNYVAEVPIRWVDANGQVSEAGTASVSFAPSSDGFDISATLPDAMTAAGLTLTIGAQRIAGTWSRELGILSSYHLDIARVAFSGPGFAHEYRGLAASRSFVAGGEDRFDVAESVRLTGVKAVGGGEEILADDITVEIGLKDFRAAALREFSKRMGVDWRTGEVISKFQAPTDIPDLIGETSLTFRLSGAAAKRKIGGERADRLEIILSATGLDRAASRIALAASGEGLSFGDVALNSFAIQTAVEDLPLGRIVDSATGKYASFMDLTGGTEGYGAVEFGGLKVKGPTGKGIGSVMMMVIGAYAADAMLSGPEKAAVPLLALLREAGTRLDVARIAFDRGDLYGLDLHGAATAASGTLNLTVRGADRALAEHGASIGIPPAIRALAQKAKDEAGRPLEIYDVSYDFGTGRVTVNDKDVTEVIAAPAAPAKAKH